MEERGAPGVYTPGMDERFRRAIEGLDALHAEDPRTVIVDGAEVPEELLYARRMTAALARLTSAPSEALSLAVRAQHLCRWRLPRARYPEGRAGYHAWRREQAKQHASLAASTLREAGYDEDIVARVTRLIEKKDRARDPEAQALEDAACLVFLEHELDGFAEGREDAQLIAILQKTWPKMSEHGRALALELPLSTRGRALLDAALAG